MLEEGCWRRGCCRRGCCRRGVGGGVLEEGCWRRVLEERVL